MDVNYPYYPPQYSENRTERQDELALPITTNSSDEARSSLLSTEPKDLDKLFDRCSFQVELDICFPDKSDKSMETISDQLSVQKSKESLRCVCNNKMDKVIEEQKVKRRENTISVNLNGLSWFKQNHPLNTTTSSLGDTILKKRNHSSSLDEKGLVKKKLSLYGDNHHILDNELKQDHVDRYMYYHPDTGCIRGRTLLDLKLPNASLEDLLMKENYWIDITSPSAAEMKAISKVSLYLYRKQ
jgi:hypothetical protein